LVKVVESWGLENLLPPTQPQSIRPWKVCREYDCSWLTAYHRRYQSNGPNLSPVSCPAMQGARSSILARGSDSVFSQPRIGRGRWKLASMDKRDLRDDSVSNSAHKLVRRSYRVPPCRQRFLHTAVCSCLKCFYLGSWLHLLIQSTVSFGLAFHCRLGENRSDCEQVCRGNSRSKLPTPEAYDHCSID